MLAPFNGNNVLEGNTFANNANRAVQCLTFDYGASLTTHPLAGTTIEINNFQIQADEKAFLFETIDETTRVIVTDLYNSEVSVCWFGAVADGSTNCLIPFQRSIDCFRKDSDQLSNTIIVPAQTSNFYVFTNPLAINRQVKITGSTYRIPILQFQNSSGIIVNAGFCTINNLEVRGPINWELGNYNRVGITIFQTVYMDNVRIWRFDGNGLEIDGSVVNSNTNTSKFNNLRIEQNGNNGIFIRGANANAMLFTGIDVRDNSACGIRDQSLLGNTYVGCHSNGSSTNGYNRSRVFHNNSNYICIQDNPGNIEPGTTNSERFWRFNGGAVAPIAPYSQWVENRTYVMSFGFALFSINGNAANTMIGSYSEENELPLFSGYYTLSNVFSSNTQNIVLGGTNNDVNYSGSIVCNNGVIRTTKFGTNIKVDTQLREAMYSLFGSKLSNNNRISAYLPLKVNDSCI